MELFEINTDNFSANILEDGLYNNRTNFSSSLSLNRNIDSEVTISVLSYNRIEKTKQCIESILKYTKNINYDLILIDNGSSDGTLEYFKSLNYNKKHIIHITKNIGAAYAFSCININSLSNYYINVSNDLIVTENWLSNLLNVAKSDPRIGMVCPMSSNVSNLQDPCLSFNNLTEMQQKAAKYNVSDQKKWHERLRLVTVTALYSKGCICTIGWPVNDIGFLHDFSDDDVSFKIRRAGYKIILTKDTWIHHNHDVFHLENKDPKEFQKSLDIGRENFHDKYYGVDAWDDVNNYIPEIIPKIKVPADKNNCSILGVDVKCGTPILEIKNQLRSFGAFDATCCAVTSEGKYFIDLQTVCGADNVFACSPENAFGYLPQDSFDYIIIGNGVNEYPEPYKVIKSIYSLLKKGGQMFFYLKNSYNIFSLLNVIGYRNVHPTSYAYNMTIETLINDLKGMNMSPQVIGAIPYNNIPAEYINAINSKSNIFVKENWEETKCRLTSDRFAFLIVK